MEMKIFRLHNRTLLIKKRQKKILSKPLFNLLYTYIFKYTSNKGIKGNCLKFESRTPKLKHNNRVELLKSS